MKQPHDWSYIDDCDDSSLLLLSVYRDDIVKFKVSPDETIECTAIQPILADVNAILQVWLMCNNVKYLECKLQVNK